MTDVACPGCDVRLPPIDGPVHRYMRSSPACWQMFGRVLAREYEDPAYFQVHHLTVDAYAVQHPGDDSPQAAQSVGLHLLRLHLLLERELEPDRVRAATRDAVRDKGYFAKLTRPATMGNVVVTDVLAAESAARHSELVRAWSFSAWNAWKQHHAAVRKLAERWS